MKFKVDNVEQKELRYISRAKSNWMQDGLVTENYLQDASIWFIQFIYLPFVFIYCIDFL